VLTVQRKKLPILCHSDVYIARVSTGYRPNNKEAQLLLEKTYYSLFPVAVLTFKVIQVCDDFLFG